MKKIIFISLTLFYYTCISQPDELNINKVQKMEYFIARMNNEITGDIRNQIKQSNGTEFYLESMENLWKKFKDQYKNKFGEKIALNKFSEDFAKVEKEYRLWQTTFYKKNEVDYILHPDKYLFPPN